MMNYKEINKESFVYENFKFRPYNSLAEVFDFIKPNDRVPNNHPSLEPTIVYVQEKPFGPTEEYWWDGGTMDFNLVKKPYMNKVPFDYSLIEKGYTVQTENGIEVKELFLFSRDAWGYPLRALVSGFVQAYTINGIGSNRRSDRGLNLVMCPPIDISYHIYNPFKWERRIYTTLEEAENNSSLDEILLKIESIGKSIISKTIV